MFGRTLIKDRDKWPREEEDLERVEEFWFRGFILRDEQGFLLECSGRGND